MDRNETARNVAKLMKRQARLMGKLQVVQGRICDALCTVARSEEAGLDPDVVAFSIAPQEED